MSKQIASVILSQLGGNRFCAMTGANQLVSYNADENGEGAMSCKFKGSKKANFLKVTLLPSDTYRMEFKKIWGGKIKDVETLDMVYCDQLESIFEKVTGLYTRF